MTFSELILFAHVTPPEFVAVWFALSGIWCGCAFTLFDDLLDAMFQRPAAARTLYDIARPHPAPPPKNIAVGQALVPAEGDDACVDAERLVLARLGFDAAWERWCQKDMREFEHEFDRALDHLECATKELK